MIVGTNLVPYNKLPPAQQHKDAIFQGVVRAVAAELQELGIYSEAATATQLADH